MLEHLPVNGGQAGAQGTQDSGGLLGHARDEFSHADDVADRRGDLTRHDEAVGNVPVGLAWCHGEAFAARLAAQRLEGPAQLAGAEYGYNAELCSYARTHLGCSVLTLKSTEGERSVVVGMNDSKELAARLPSPDFFVNNYAGCSTGQQWDGISYRVFGKELPIFNISHPFLWGNKPDAGYLRGEEWEAASRYVADQLRDLISFLEAQTGRPFDYDALSEAMTYIKRAAELRREGLDLCKAKPAPATPPAAGTRSCSPTCG